MKFGLIIGILCLLISCGFIWMEKGNVYEQLSSYHFMSAVFGMGIGVIVGNLCGYFTGRCSGKRNAMKNMAKNAGKTLKEAAGEIKEKITGADSSQTL